MLNKLMEAVFAPKQPKNYRGRHRGRALFGWLVRPRGATVEELA